MDENKLRFGVGVLVIAAIGIGIILTFLFGAFPAILNQEYTLNVYFPSAEGVNTNTPVLRDGVKIGRVADIQLKKEGGVLLTLSLDQKHEMTHQYVPQIGIGSLITGDAKLEFKKWAQEDLLELFSNNQDIIDKPFTDGELYSYGKKLEDPFSLLFSMEDELRTTFKSIQGAGDAFQEIGDSVQGLVRDVRGVIGVEESPQAPMPIRDGASLRRPWRSNPIAFADAPAWAKPVKLISGRSGLVAVSGGMRASTPYTSGSLSSGVVQTVAMQSPSGSFVPPSGSGMLPGPADQPTLREMAAEAITTLEEFQGAIRDARAILGNEQLRDGLTQSVEKFPGLLDEAKDTLQVTQETFESFGRVGEQFEQVGGVAEEAVEEVKVVVTETLESFQQTAKSFQGTAKNIEAFTEPLGERGGELLEAVLRSLANVDNALIQLDTFGKTLNNSDGTLKRLLEDDELYFQVRRTIENVEAATARVRPILDDVRVFTDKIARDPRQLGVRGALNGRPNGAGLK